MAITATALTSGSSISSGSSFDTASVAPTANRLVVVAVTLQAASAAPPTGISGAGLTFVSWVENNNGATNQSTSLWRAMSASPSSGALTITHSGATNPIWSVFELDGVVTTGTNGADAINANTATAVDITGSATTLTVTLGAFGHANNGTVGAFAWLQTAGSPATATAGTGFTEIHDLGLTDTGTSWALETEWRADNDTSVNNTWSAAGGIFGVAAEVVASGTVSIAVPAGAMSLIGRLMALVTGSVNDALIIIRKA
jgi:hypothetical protein